MNTNSNSPRLLVVDDNSSIHDDFRKILCRETADVEGFTALETALFGERAPASNGSRHFRMDSAYQGQEGLAAVERAMAENDPYAMAFVDVRMPPGWDGIETIEAIWKLYPDLQVVVCTAYSDYAWTDLRDRLGCSDRLVILKKPFDNIEVLQLAHALTEKWNLLQQSRVRMQDLERMVNERTAALQETNRQLEAEVAERKAAEHTLRETQELVLRQERLAVVGQLSAGVAHDFNNIMTIVQGHAGLLLLTEGLPADAVVCAQEITDASQRASKLTQQLLAFSRKQTLRLADVDLAEVLRGMSLILRRAVGDRVSLSIALENNATRVRADAALFEQILMNLAVNARDAMPAGGSVVLRTETMRFSQADLARHPESRIGSFVCISVRDTGCGMDAATIKRIFEPFFTTKDLGKGTGLGLATVYGIARQHQGWIEVESESGRGTEFRVFLPQAHPVTAPMEKPCVGQTILIVDDEDAVRRLAKSLCERAGWRVLEANSGIAALEVAAKAGATIDLVLTDVMMPEGMSGFELGERLRANHPELKVIFTSGYSARMTEREDLQEGDNFISKPYSTQTLLQILRNARTQREGALAA